MLYEASLATELMSTFSVYDSGLVNRLALAYNKNG